jgi:hypothetical protein
MSVSRIASQRDVNAMVALDNFDLIEARVRKLLSYGRRISMTQRYTYVGHAPELHVGLTLDTDARGDGITSYRDDSGAHFGVFLKPGLMSGFGFSAYTSDGNATEAEAWKRYHAKKATSADFFERRRRMTQIRLVGGMEGDFGPARDDLIEIKAWNDDGVCSERVIGFDTLAYWATQDGAS